jgi:uncharacterized protein YbaP (TraB family)
MWRVKSPQGGELYILGSVHVGVPQMYPLQESIYDAFGKSGRLVVELEGAAMNNSPGVIRQVMEEGFYPEGETLMSHLDERQRELLTPFVGNLPLKEQTNMKPWLAAVTLDMLMLTKLGYSTTEGVDRHFELKAQERNIPIHSLETAEEQIGIFITLPEEDSKLLLESSLIELGEVENFMGEVIEAWQNGDEGRFADAFFEAYRRWPKLVPLLDKVIYARNETMYQRLLPYLEMEGPSFVVIGSGHVVTDRGIPGLFRSKGFEVEKF